MSDLEDTFDEVTGELEGMSSDISRSGSEVKSMSVWFQDAIQKQWFDAANDIKKLASAKTEDERKRSMEHAISHVIKTLTSAQRQVWAAHNVLEGLKRGEKPLQIATNMESAGVIESRTLSEDIKKIKDDQVAASELATSSRWIIARATKVVLLMAKALDRILAVVATLIKIKPRVGIVLGVAPAVDVSWEIGDASIKDVIDAMIKGFG
jgi:hypothetical protein